MGPFELQFAISHSVSSTYLGRSLYLLLQQGGSNSNDACPFWVIKTANEEEEEGLRFWG